MRIMEKKSEDHLRYLVTSVALHDDIIYEEEPLNSLINGSELFHFHSSSKCLSQVLQVI